MDWLVNNPLRKNMFSPKANVPANVRSRGQQARAEFEAWKAASNTRAKRNYFNKNNTKKNIKRNVSAFNIYKTRNAGTLNSNASINRLRKTLKNSRNHSIASTVTLNSVVGLSNNNFNNSNNSLPPGWKIRLSKSKNFKPYYQYNNIKQWEHPTRGLPKGYTKFRNTKTLKYYYQAPNGSVSWNAPN